MTATAIATSSSSISGGSSVIFPGDYYTGSGWGYFNDHYNYDQTYDPNAPCPNCGLRGMHGCTGGTPVVQPIITIGTGTASSPPFDLFTVPECALCDTPLKFGEKKVCVECRGVFDAWKFLTKKDPEPEPEAT